MKHSDSKERASRLEDKIIASIDRACCRMIAIKLPLSEWNRVIRNLEDRADGLAAQLPPEPALRRHAIRKSEECRKISENLADTLRSIRA